MLVETRLETATYEALGRVTATLAPAQGTEPTVTATSVTYDGLGRVGETTYHDATGTPYAALTTSYDLASRVTGTALTGAVTGSTALTYDALDRVTGLSSTGPAGTASLAVAYNLADQPTQVTRTAFGSSLTITNTYATTGEQRSLAAAGLTWQMSSDTRGITQLASERALLTRSYDVAGRLAAIRAGRRWSDSGSYSDLFESRLSYDTRDRVASVAYAGDGTAYDYADTYSYDPAGRLASWGRTGEGATSATYAWDAACNLTSKTQGGTTTTFVSDADDRLTSATTGSVVTTYTHDLYGRRTSAASPQGTTTYGWNPL
ncbi:MAG: hypothetical protein JXP72_08415, partial [Coriobacteriia bacterium]|nr:hypothetical protein [Coriobacteriia bacterium]